MRRRPRRQRAAISQAEIRKKCKLYGEVLHGFNAYRRGIPIHAATEIADPKKREAWVNGWRMARDKQEEKGL